MEHRRSSQNYSPHMMSSLLSGSIADEHSQAAGRARQNPSNESYDPFSSPPRSRYSPPRTILLENPTFDSRTHFQGDLANRFTSTSHSPYTMSTSDSATNRIGTLQGVLHSERGDLPELSLRRGSQDHVEHHPRSSVLSGGTDVKLSNRVRKSEPGGGPAQGQTKRRPLNQDEFDGPSQYLSLPLPEEDQMRARDLPQLPVHLDVAEQDDILRKHNDILSGCAFHFIAKYQFPIPLERDRLPVRNAVDRDWTEWAYLLKRLATKRRIPARVLHENQIRQLVTVLENSMTMRHPKPREQACPGSISKDDRYILQLISAGIQVAQILMDSFAMELLINLYVETEDTVLRRRQRDQASTIRF